MDSFLETEPWHRTFSRIFIHNGCGIGVAAEKLSQVPESDLPEPETQQDTTYPNHRYVVRAETIFFGLMAAESIKSRYKPPKKTL